MDLSLSLEGYNQAVDEDNGFIDNDYSGKINNGFAKQKKFIESNGTISGHNSNDVSDKELSKKRGRAESVSSVDGRRVNNGKAVSLYDCLEDFTYKETLTEPIVSAFHASFALTKLLINWLYSIMRSLA